MDSAVIVLDTGGGGRVPLFGTGIAGADVGSPPIIRITDLTNGTATQFYAFDRHFTGGIRVALADVNGDSIPDYIAAAGPSGGPHARSK